MPPADGLAYTPHSWRHLDPGRLLQLPDAQLNEVGR